MIYTLNDLLMKMGAPETKERGSIRWHYFDRSAADIGGFAEVRLLDGGSALVAELKHWRQGEEEAESFYLQARRSGERYEVTKISFDGADYDHPPKSVIELGLSLFHARALHISILMVEQAFNRQDILRPVVDENLRLTGVPRRLREPFKKETWGVVVPFRPRSSPASAISP